MKTALNRVVGISLCALVLAVAAAIAAVWYSDAQRIAKLRQEEQRQQERAKRELAKRPPPLPELPPAIDAKEVARIRAAAIAQPPRGKKSEYSWEQIEAILDDLRKQRANRPQAGIDLEQWYEYLALPEFTGTNDADMHMAELMAWQNAMPTSSTPLVVKARFFILVGWQARGSGFSPTVTSEGAIVFRGALAKAQEALGEATKLGVKDGEAYAALIDVAKGLGLPKEITRVLLKKGMQSDPAYTRLYSAAAEYFLPRWHGEAGEVETLANEIATAAGEHGYAAMGHMAFTVNRYDPSTLFYGRYDWKQLAKAGDALARSYPNDPDLVAFAALCAYAAQDHEVSRRVQAFMTNEEINLVPNWPRLSGRIAAWCRLRSVSHDETEHLWGPQGQPGTIAFDRDPRYLWCGFGGTESLVRLVDRQTRETVLPLSGPEGVVNALTVDESRKWVAAIVVSSDSHGWVLWNIKSPDNPVVTPTMDMPRSIALSPTGEQLAVGFTQHVQIFDVSQATNGPKIELKETPHFVNYSRDGKLLAINNRVFNALSGEQKYDLRDSASTLPSPFLLQNLFLIDRLQRPLVTASSGVPNADRNRALLRLESDGRWTTLLSDVSSSVQYAFSSDDRLMAIMEEDDANQRYAIAVFGVESGKRVKRLGGHSSRIDSLVFSPDGKKLASIAMMNGVIRIWDLAQEVNTLPVSGEDK